jgi:predicted nucleotidyltransferase
MEQKHKEIVWNILKNYPYQFYVFGSRATGKHHTFSDLDIFVKEPLKKLEGFYIRDAFGESDLPFTVDLVEKENCKENFINLIKKDLVPVNKENLGIK